MNLDIPFLFLLVSNILGLSLLIWSGVVFKFWKEPPGWCWVLVGSIAYANAVVTFVKVEGGF